MQSMSLLKRIVSTSYLSMSAWRCWLLNLNSANWCRKAHKQCARSCINSSTILLLPSNRTRPAFKYRWRKSRTSCKTLLQVLEHPLMALHMHLWLAVRAIRHLWSRSRCQLMQQSPWGDRSDRRRTKTRESASRNKFWKWRSSRTPKKRKMKVKVRKERVTTEARGHSSEKISTSFKVINSTVTTFHFKINI